MTVKPLHDIILQKEVDTIREQNQKDAKFLEEKLNKKDKEIGNLNIQDQNNVDAISALSDKIEELMLEIELLKEALSYSII